LDTLVNFERAEPRFPGQFSTRGNKLSLMYFAQVKRIGVELLYTSSGLKLPHAQAA
jgi:hypothetical protein